MLNAQPIKWLPEENKVHVAVDEAAHNAKMHRAMSGRMQDQRETAFLGLYSCNRRACGCCFFRKQVCMLLAAFSGRLIYRLVAMDRGSSSADPGGP
jgi:hypothetical protein